MRTLLAPDLVAYITNADGGEDTVRGRDVYLARIEAMDLPAASFRVEPTQAPVAVDDELVTPSGGWFTQSRPRATASGPSPPRPGRMPARVAQSTE